MNDGFVKSDLFRRGGIFAESNSKKHPHCHFERQRVLSFRAAASFVISSGSEKSLAIKIPRHFRSSE